MPHDSSIRSLFCQRGFYCCCPFAKRAWTKVDREQLCVVLLSRRHQTPSVFNMFMWSMMNAQNDTRNTMNAKVIWTIVMKCVHWQHIITRSLTLTHSFLSWYVPNVRIKWCILYVFAKTFVHQFAFFTFSIFCRFNLSFNHV